ncbi:MAG: hypothetical protein N3A71_01200 [Candidatus Dojkabacteria bacterium]|nr:hypothetical protein [Candidatus Dojkabacteria bacterium]
MSLTRITENLRKMFQGYSVVNVASAIFEMFSILMPLCSQRDDSSDNRFAWTSIDIYSCQHRDQEIKFDGVKRMGLFQRLHAAGIARIVYTLEGYGPAFFHPAFSVKPPQPSSEESVHNYYLLLYFNLGIKNFVLRFPIGTLHIDCGPIKQLETGKLIELNQDRLKELNQDRLKELSDLLQDQRYAVQLGRAAILPGFRRRNAASRNHAMNVNGSDTGNIYQKVGRFVQSLLIDISSSQPQQIFIVSLINKGNQGSLSGFKRVVRAALNLQTDDGFDNYIYALQSPEIPYSYRHFMRYFSDINILAVPSRTVNPSQHEQTNVSTNIT